MTLPASRLHRLSDPLDPARARALQAALGQEPDIAAGSPLPGFFHQIYFWDPRPPRELGPDGHPRPDHLIPGLALTRRMWAAGRVVFHQPLIAGMQAERITAVEAVTRREGRSGTLAFVRLRHDIRQRRALALTEWQELVYRAAAGEGPAPVPPRAPETAEVAYDWQADSTLLFRYSALTCNGHRIHYDADYARDVEGYGGLVVHGPLLVQMLVMLAEATAPLTEISYRATAPLLSGEAARLCAQGQTLWVAGSDGRQCMTARVR